MESTPMALPKPWVECPQCGKRWPGGCECRDDDISWLVVLMLIVLGALLALAYCQSPAQ